MTALILAAAEGDHPNKALITVLVLLGALVLAALYSGNKS